MGAGPRRDKDSRCRNSLAPVPRRPGLQHVLGAGGLFEERTGNRVATPVPPGPCCQAHAAPQTKTARPRFFFQAEDGIRDRSRHSCEPLFRSPSRLPMMFILWMVAMMVVIIPSRTV